MGIKFLLSKFKRSHDGKLIFTIILWVLLSRIIIHLVAYAGYLLFKNKSLYLLDSLKIFWNRWDALHYLHLAENWYHGSGEARFLIVYYPLYPLTIKLVKFLAGDYYIAGFIVSNLSLIIAGIFLYRLTEMDFGEEIAWRSLRYLLFFPFSFFLAIIYSDSLFLALTLIALYYMRKQKWFLVGIVGLLASMTRNFGVLLVVPALVEYLQSSEIFDKIKKKQIDGVFKGFGWKWIFILLIPIGTIIYLLINWWVTGNCFTFLIYQREHWHQNFGLVWNNIYNITKNALYWPPKDRVSLWIPQVILFWFSIGIFFYSIKKLRLSYLFYLAIYLFFVFSPTWLLSGPRYLMGAFPIYLALGLVTENRTIDFIISFIMLAFTTFFIFAFTMGFYVM